MASLINILKKFASVNNSVINSVELTQDSSGVYTVRVHLRPHANHACRCPICGRKGNIYDKAKKERCWRALDCGGIIIKALRAYVWVKIHALMLDNPSPYAAFRRSVAPHLPCSGAVR